MTLRSRLAWAFVAMLIVPGFILMGLAMLTRGFWDPSVGDKAWAGGRDADLRSALAVVNELLLDKADTVLEPDGFQKLEDALGPGLALAVYKGEAMVLSSPDFTASLSYKHHKIAPYSWRFRLSDGSLARIDLTWSAKGMAQVWGPWFLGTMVVVILVLILTNGILTWLIGRSILKPLASLEHSVQTLAKGDLETKIVHRGSAEFSKLSQALDGLRVRLKTSLAERHALEEERRIWVASVSHDIRTPLSVIRAYAEALHQGQARALEKQGRYHEVILERSLHMERLVDDLFQWARWDWNEPKLQLQTLDLAEELERSRTAWLIDWPDLEVKVDLGTKPVPILADAIALRRILDNLARNAHQHGGSHCTLNIYSSKDSEKSPIWQLVFHNNGPAIPEEHLSRIFERFYRVDAARNAQQGGGGLGLTIALTLAQAMGGSLTASNPPGGGAAFTLSLPRVGDLP